MKTFGADWIWSEDIEKNQYLEFSCSLNWNGESATTFYVSAETNYCLYLNGEYAASGQYHDYPECKFYDSIDITRFLKKGDNTVRIIGYAANENFFWHVASSPAIIFEAECNGEIVLASGSGTLCRRAEGYMTGKVPVISNQLGYGYAYDFTSFKNSGYSLCKVVAGRSKKLNLRPVKMLDVKSPEQTTVITQGVFIDGVGETAASRMQTSFMAHRLINALTDEANKPVLTYGKSCYEFSTAEFVDGVYFVVDLGCESAGYLSFELETDENCTVTVGFGEHLDDLRVRSEIGGRNFALLFKCKKGINKFDDYLKRIGLRYLQFFVHSKSFKLKYAGIRKTEYPLTELPVKITDSLHRKIYDVSVNTLKLCMHEHYEDCPWREQCQYAMDSRTQMLCGYYAFNEFEFPRASLKLMVQKLRKDGNLPLCSPTVLDLCIPVFSFVYITAVKEYTDYSGDKTLAAEVYDKCVKVVERYVSLGGGDLLTRDRTDPSVWNFYDWTDNMVNNWGDHEIAQDDTEYPAPLNAHFSIALQALSYLAGVIGKKKDEKKYAELHEHINERINDVFWNGDKNVYATYLINDELSGYDELTQSLIVCCGAATGSKKESVLKALIGEGEKLNELTLSQHIYKYDALLCAGDKYYDYVKNDIEQKWGYMLYNGATSFWETLKGGDDFFYAGSLCHGWSALPVYIYRKYGLGITE